MSLRPGLAAAAAAVAAFAIVTMIALEGGRVAVLETVQPDGSPRTTRVWVASRDGALWVEAATAGRPFYRDLESHPELLASVRESCLASMGPPLRLRAELVEEPGGHERIRELLAEDYGWADAWIGLLQDTSRSRAVRLVPVSDSVPAH